MANKTNISEFIIIHHTATPQDESPRTFDAVRKYHMEVKGWNDIGYNWFIEKEKARIYKGRDEDTVGAHCKEENMNYRSIGICLEGNYDLIDELPTDEMIKALKNVIFNIRLKYNIPRENIKFHRDYATYKSCPGAWWTREKLLKLMRLRELKRDEKGGFWFIKQGDDGKQKIPTQDKGVAGLLTLISREFGVDTMPPSYFEKLDDKKYF